MFKYGNYIAKPEVDSDAGLLYGKVLNISATITFQGENVKEAEQNFRKAVDLYIQTCKAQGREPEKPFSGKLPFRTTPDIHRDIYVAATRANKSINAWMEDVLSRAAQQVETSSSVVSDNYQQIEISPAEFKQLLDQLERRLNQLQAEVEPYLQEKPGNFDRFLQVIKPFLKDKDLPILIEKVEAFNEWLKSIQAQKAPFHSFIEKNIETNELVIRDNNLLSPKDLDIFEAKSG